MGKCKNCQAETGVAHNYCDWKCHVELTQKDGGIVHAPSGLPIRCIRYDGLMLECEGGDHPDYKFPVNAEYVGDKGALGIVNGNGEERECSEEELREQSHETHALIYTDGAVAITTYECCYAMWDLSTGLLDGGSLWERRSWRLTGESLEKIRQLAVSKNELSLDK